MISRRCLCVAFSVCIAAASAEDTWKTKEIAAWSEADAQEFLNESPWIKTFTPEMKQGSGNGAPRTRMSPGGINVGGIGVGMPGMGGMGRRGGGYPGGGQSRGDSASNPGAPPKLTLRWESAMPVRAAEIKVHDDDAPTLDEKHYAIAVYGIADRMLTGEPKKLQEQLKKDASLKRDGKKDFNPSSVEVLERPNGPVVVYLFPNTTEIGKTDRRVEFNAVIGPAVIAQSFFTNEMVWRGKLEL